MIYCSEMRRLLKRLFPTLYPEFVAWIDDKRPSWLDWAMLFLGLSFLLIIFAQAIDDIVAYYIYESQQQWTP
jgi:hypothetical protein